ncbi:DNA-binding protein [Phytophthora palmivora]|uniref:DNA-binding protein n=1 Tax=Phytophthora palmivora TaxID=4796 RepID=A0A2P4X7M2_9STRA|nr:DNA-binding protein [Phytophthora palmivora]
MYGVHFAALHRRVKKRAQGGQSKGNNGYFHPSDEAGIMRVVVARAELGVLMTFDELMRLVEAAALRKLPDISHESC